MKNLLTKEFLKVSNKMQLNIVLASRKSDQNRVAIHLLEPTEAELYQALETAEKDNFKCIVLHTKFTWPK